MIKKIDIESFENHDIWFSLDHIFIKAISVTIFGEFSIFPNSVRIIDYDKYSIVIRSAFFDYEQFISELKSDLKKHWSVNFNYKIDQTDINYINVYLKKYFLYKGLY